MVDKLMPAFSAALSNFIFSSVLKTFFFSSCWMKVLSARTVTTLALHETPRRAAVLFTASLAPVKVLTEIEAISSCLFKKKS